jgi:hypothetical protein
VVGLSDELPRLLGRQPETVRLFVFHHECGHHHVGGNEMAADCWAVRQGVRQGWLATAGLGSVCRSFGNGPARGRYPAGAERCAALRTCFATASAALAKERSVAASAAAPTALQGAAYAPPKLLSVPALAWAGTVRAAEAEKTPEDSVTFRMPD